jgi:Flp pilus assembly protein TadG
LPKAGKLKGETTMAKDSSYRRALVRITHSGAILRAMRPLAKDNRGIVAIAMALLFVPVVMIVGAAVDYARLEQFKTQLQSTVDSAALSGAAAYVDASSSSNAQTVANNYLTSNETLLPGHVGSISSTVSASQVTTGSNQGYTVSVSATGTIGTTFMRMITSTLNVSASATAVNPLVTITINASNFNSSAADFNTLWYWLISASSPSALPSTSQFTSSSGLKLGCNHGCSNTSVTFTASASQQIGMALENETAGLSDYGVNYDCTSYQTVPTTTTTTTTYDQQTHRNVTTTTTTYGTCKGSTQWYFSNLMPPSANSNNVSSIDTGYQISQNCSLQVQLSTSTPTTNTPPISGQCFTSLPQYAYPSCAQMNGQYANFYWNDMGGYPDDKDYNDAEISISCAGISGSGNSATGVYLSS